MRKIDLLKSTKGILYLIVPGLIILALAGAWFLGYGNSGYVAAGISASVALMSWYCFNNYSGSILKIYKRVQALQDAENQNTGISSTDKFLGKIFDVLETINYKIEEASHSIQVLGEKEKLEWEHLDENDALGKSLVKMNTTMRTFNVEESKRKWKVEGLAKFAEHLREDHSDLEMYSFKLISELVKYTGCNQGGIYMHYKEEDTEYLELKAAYAYERRKYNEKRIEVGQGLLGQCIYEKSTIFITDVPDNYVTITSGLGEAVPRNIVIIPLLLNDELYGAVELASFKILEQYRVDFLEELAESIAASFGSIKTAENTKALLEESQKLAVELQSREEEMRQNMEELAATQEDMQRNQAQLDGIFNAIDSTLAMTEFDTSGKVIKANDILLRIIGQDNKSIKAQTFENIIGQQNKPAEIWSTLIKKEKVFGDYNINSVNGMIWIEATFTPVLNNHGNVEKILMLSKDITAAKELALENERREVELNSHIEAINKTIASCEYNMQGELVGANDIFLGITGFQLEEIVGKHHFDLIPKADRDKPQTELMWGGIKEGKFFSGEFKLMSSQGKELWLTGTYNPILDPSGNPYKVMMFAQFTTAEKEKKVELTGSVNALKSTLPVIEVRPDRVFKSANQLFFEEFGYKRMELRGKTFEEIVGDPSVNHIVGIFEKVQNNEFTEEIITFHYPDKSKKKFRTTFTPIFDLEDQLSKIVIVMVDLEMALAFHDN